jgi:hypothetical protein
MRSLHDAADVVLLHRHLSFSGYGLRRIRKKDSQFTLFARADG